MSAPPPPPPDRGLACFRGYSGLTFAFAWIPVMWTHFTVTRGLSPDAYASLWATYYLAMVVFELPWGWLADRVGRRPVLVSGPLLLGLAFVLLGRSRELPVLHALMALTGAGHALISGADSAWLYDHLTATGRREHALHEETVAHRWRLLGVSAVDAVGGLVAHALGTTAAFDLSAAVMLAAAALAWRLPEARRAPEVHLRPRLSRAAASLAAPGVPWVLGWYLAVFVLLRVGFQLYQPTLLAAGADDLRIHGLVLAALNLVAGLSAFVVLRVFGALGERGTAALVLLLLAASFGGLALGAPWALTPLFTLQQVSFGFLQPIGRTALNQRIPAGERAALLSVQSLLARLAFGALLFGVAWDAALTSALPRTYALLAGAAAGCAVLAMALHPRGRPRLETGPGG